MTLDTAKAPSCEGNPVHKLKCNHFVVATPTKQYAPSKCAPNCESAKSISNIEIEFLCRTCFDKDISKAWYEGHATYLGNISASGKRRVIGYKSKPSKERRLFV
jgi:hypothetical protein